MSAVDQQFVVVPSSGYPSLAALRAGHLALLEQRRIEGDTPASLWTIRAFVERGIATGLILAEDSERFAAQSLLDYWANALHRAGVEPPDATLADFDPLLAPELPDYDCPYVGLDAFHENDQPRFFGRQQLNAEMIERLRSQRLLAVVGPSGSGKSSVVRAGLIPLLRDGTLPGSEGLLYLPPLVPGSDPLASLAHAIRPRGVDPARWSRIIQNLREQPDCLTKLLNQLTRRAVVITIDQFEELFTLCPNELDRQMFVENLLSLVRASDRPHIVLLTMRVDYEEFVQRMPELHELFASGRVPVVPLNAAEMREAIEQPAQQAGLHFQAGVVERLLQDILGEPAGLPLLQFTLLKLWENRQRNRVTLEVYERVGGGRLALARSADAFFDGLILEDQTTARRILLKMVRPSEGMEVTSSRILRSALFIGSGDTGRVERVLEKLIESRLVRLTKGDTIDDDQVEVAHEALVRNWPTLVEWLEKERDAIRQRLRLRETARQWDSSGRDPALLWRGTVLEEAILYKDLDKIERAFVRAGLSVEAKLLEDKERAEQERERAKQEREQARENELRQAQELAKEQELRAKAESERAAAERLRAEEQGRSAGRLRRLAVGLFVVLLVAIGAAILAGIQQVALGQTQQRAAEARTTSEYAQGHAATAGTQGAQAATQAAAAQATSNAAATAAILAAIDRKTAISQAQALGGTADMLQGTVDVAVSQFDQSKQTATVVQANALIAQQAATDAVAAAATADAAAEVARAEATAAQQDAQAAQETASVERANAENALVTAGIAQTSAAEAQSTAKAAQTDVANAEYALETVIQAPRKTQEAGATQTAGTVRATRTPTPTPTP